MKRKRKKLSAVDTDYTRFNKFKILMHAQAINNLLENGVATPIMIDFELSNFCNHNCIWCEPIEFRLKNQQMLSKKTIKQTLNDIASLGAKSVRFDGGGEPMTSPYFAEAIKIAKQKKLTVLCNSNGSLINKNLNALLKYCDYLRISLDAATMESHNRLHRPAKNADFDEVMSGLKNLVAKRKTTKSPIEIGVSFLIHPQNYKQILLFAKKIKAFGVDFVLFRPVHLLNSGKAKMLKIIPTALKLVRTAKTELEDERFKIRGISQTSAVPQFEREWTLCYAPFFMPVLGATGKIYACCDRRDIELGEYNKAGFSKIYLSKAYSYKIKKIMTKSCKRCAKSDFNEIIHFCFEKDSLKKDLLGGWMTPADALK